MVLAKSLTAYEDPPVIDGGRVYLRPPRMGDFAEWSALRLASEAFLKPWEPTWPVDDLTRPAFRRRLKRYQREMREDRTYPFFVFEMEEGRLVGGVTISNVARGVQQSATMGYWAGERHAGNGYTTAAVRALIPYVFEEMRLHRLMAACLPENEPSKAVLRKCGFQHEGYARGYLRIDGAWRDHVVFAILRDDPRP